MVSGRFVVFFLKFGTFRATVTQIMLVEVQNSTFVNAWDLPLEGHELFVTSAQDEHKT